MHANLENLLNLATQNDVVRAVAQATHANPDHTVAVCVVLVSMIVAAATLRAAFGSSR